MITQVSIHKLIVFPPQLQSLTVNIAVSQSNENRTRQHLEVLQKLSMAFSMIFKCLKRWSIFKQL